MRSLAAGLVKSARQTDPRRPLPLSYLARSLVLAQWTILLTLLALLLRRILQGTGLTHTSADLGAIFICSLFFIVGYVLPCETDRRALNRLAKHMLPVMYDTRLKCWGLVGVSAVGLALFSIGALHVLPQVDLSASFIARGFASLVVLAVLALQVRPFLTPDAIVRIGRSLITLPVLFVLCNLGLAALLGRILTGLPVLLFVALWIAFTALSFLFVDRRLRTRLLQMKSIESNVDDALWDLPVGRPSLHPPDALSRDELRTSLLAYMNYLIKAGHLKEAERHLVKHSAVFTQRDRTKALCRLNYRRREYDTVLRLIGEYDSDTCGRSDVLTSLQALAFLRRGEPPRARDTLLQALSSTSPENPYFHVNLGIVYWHLDALDDAIAAEAHANALYCQQPKTSPTAPDICPLALNNWSYYSCMRLLAEYSHTGTIPSAAIRPIWRNAVKAFRAFQDYAYAQVLDTMGFVLLLERRYAAAAGLFAESMRLSPTPAARNHLGLLYMIGSPNYFRATRLFSETKRDLTLNRIDPEYRVAERNLDLIVAAGEAKYNEELIYFSTHLSPAPPDSARSMPPREFVEETLSIPELYMPLLKYVGASFEQLNLALVGNPERVRVRVRKAVDGRMGEYERLFADV